MEEGERLAKVEATKSPWLSSWGGVEIRGGVILALVGLTFPHEPELQVRTGLLLVTVRHRFL